MAKCFLSYSYEYRHIMEAIRGLLKALDFQSVDVVDGPDDLRPPNITVEERMRDDDCVLVLYGPANPPEKNDVSSIEAAKWPLEEAILAHGMRKPLSLIVHKGTKLPELLQDYQSPARFDFWNSQSFLENVHHVVKHLLDFKRRVDLPPGHQPYRYQKVENRFRIQRSGLLYQDWYHEVAVAESRDIFHDALTTGDKEMVDAVSKCFQDKAYEIEAEVGSDWHRVFLEPGKCNENHFQYLMRIDPPLRPGEVFGYRRSFEMSNWFPLVFSEVHPAIVRRSKNPEFPISLLQDRFFGEAVDIVYDADSLILAIHFPKRVKLKSYKVIVVEELVQMKENLKEIQRCNSKEYLKLIESPSSPERILELTVPRPLFNHSYYLVYEPSES